MATLPFLELPHLALATAAIVALSGCAISVDLGDGEERIEVDRVDAAGIDTLAVDTDNGSVEIVAADVDVIEIVGRITESDEGDGSTAIEAVDGRLEVTGVCDTGWFESCRVAFEITAPHDLGVAVDTDNGRIEIRGQAGDIDLVSDNGRIDVEELAAERARIRTDNGAIDVDVASAPRLLDVRTDNGAIDIALAAGTSYAVEATTDNGSTDIDVRTDPSSAHEVTAVSGNGSIDVREG